MKCGLNNDGGTGVLLISGLKNPAERYCIRHFGYDVAWDLQAIMDTTAVDGVESLTAWDNIDNL